jgi:vacuolar-type H+-ATPase subunit I/STV1
MSKLIAFARANSTYVVVWLIVRLFLVGAAGISFGHIVTTARALQVTGWQVNVVPLFIDGIAILGLIGRTGALGERAKRCAPALILPAGAVSLAANVFAGQTIGDKIFGALVVAGFMLVEWYTTMHSATPAKSAARKVSTETLAKAAATRQYNAYMKLTTAGRAKYVAANGVAPARPAHLAKAKRKP